MRTPSDFRSNERAAILANILFAGNRINVKFIVRRFNVSRATAHRDLVNLEVFLPVFWDEGHLLLRSPEKEIKQCKEQDCVTKGAVAL